MRTRSAPPRRLTYLRAWLAALCVATLGAAGLAFAGSANAAISIDTSASYVIVNANSGQAIDLWEWSTADGGEFRQWPRTDAVNQQFQFVSSGGGTYRLKNKHSGKVHGIAGGSTADAALVTQSADSNATSQQFRLTGSNNNAVRFLNVNSGKALEVWAMSDQCG